MIAPPEAFAKLEAVLELELGILRKWLRWATKQGQCTVALGLGLGLDDRPQVAP